MQRGPTCVGFSDPTVRKFNMGISGKGVIEIIILVVVAIFLIPASLSLVVELIIIFAVLQQRIHGRAYHVYPAVRGVVFLQVDVVAILEFHAQCRCNRNGSGIQ